MASSLSAISASQPDYVVVLLGENDVLALISPRVAQFDRLTKHLPVQPTPQSYRENMQAIVRRLKRDTPARISALLADPHWGRSKFAASLPGCGQPAY